MTKCLPASVGHKLDPDSSSTWQKLYLLLRPLIKRWVYSSGVSSWKGQENDLVEDILQESILRTFKCVEKAERGEVPPIDSLEHLSIRIACNYWKDLRRKDYRLVRVASDDHSSRALINMAGYIDASELACNLVYQEWLFVKSSQIIAKLPQKQRLALLIDLANLMHFAVQPTLLQQAFLKASIRLQDYQQPLSDNPLERSRHASLLSLAYRRIGKLTDL